AAPAEGEPEEPLMVEVTRVYLPLGLPVVDPLAPPADGAAAPADGTAAPAEAATPAPAGG
ncbi:MAG: hypothetical protein JNL89_18370, partial [Rhodanobacteraceae bacterium]|nr:hypothetical protein [Rhodanobacteraceae bacterium]